MTRILVPVDGSEPSEAALEYARETFPDATITALYVVHLAGYWSGFTANVEAMPGYEEAKAEGEEILSRVRESVGEDVDLKTELEAGSPTNVIVDYAEEGDFHTIVMGSHGREGASRVLLGSVAERVARRSPIPVTIVRCSVTARVRAPKRSLDVDMVGEPLADQRLAVRTAHAVVEDGKA